jgi:DNA mismatch repair protein MutS2
MNTDLPDYAADDFRGYAPILRETLAVLADDYRAAPTTSVPKKTADDLEWGVVLCALASSCHSELSQSVAGRLPLLRHRESLERRLREVEEAVRLLVGEDTPSVAGLRPIGAALDHARRGGALDPEELRAVAQCANIATQLRTCVQGQAERAPLLDQIADDLLPLPDISKSIGRAIEADGSIADSASPDLGALRRRVKNYQTRVRSRVEAFLKDEDFKGYLQDDFVTLREGRFVLPIRSGEKGNVGGIVHGTSQTGHTIFIEPTAVVELNNDMRLAQMEVQDEERRILARLSKLVAQKASALESNEDLLVYLDVTLAMGRLSLRLKAGRPELSRGTRLNLRRARHPALVLKAQEADKPFEVIPNDIELDEDVRVLVISGPNTGGKTVTLKTIGLCCMMARAGLHITAGPGSAVPLVNGLFTDIGDDQSIERDLSTFSAHVVNIASFLDRVGKDSVVLLDELFAGTDPTQGAALATALLERLAARGAFVAVTTHLEALKTVAFNTTGFANASMGFDLAALAPTYRLSLGLPGSSYALRIAQRLGFPVSLTDRAAELTNPGNVEIEPILRQLETVQRRLERKESELGRERAELGRKQKDLERELRKLKKRETGVVHTETKEALAEVASVRALLRDQTRRLQAAGDEIDHAEVARVKAAVEAKAKELEERARQTAPAPPKSQNRHRLSKLAPGDQAFVKTFKRKGKVLEVNGDKVVVQVGGIRATVRTGELLSLTDEEANPPPVKTYTVAHADDSPADDVIGPQTTDNTCDLRGMRVDEALERMELFLDTLYRSSMHGAYIIHGHGTGALKRAVRELLPTSRYVRKYRAGERGEGGDGVTVAFLG